MSNETNERVNAFALFCSQLKIYKTYREFCEVWLIWERWSIVFCSFFSIWIFSLIIKFYFFIFSKNHLRRNGERFWTLLGWVRAQFTRGQSGHSISSALLFQIVFALSVLSKNKFEKILILFFDWFLIREKNTGRIYCSDP